MDLTYCKPLPENDPLTQPYWEYALDNKLSIQYCVECGHQHFPASPVCPDCLSEKQDWLVVSGHATLVSWVKFHRAYWNGFRDDLPYDVCLVKLDEGPLILSNFQGPAPDGLHAGLKLRAVFNHVTAKLSLVNFVVA